jgi:hypothetical protein
MFQSPIHNSIHKIQRAEHSNGLLASFNAAIAHALAGRKDTAVSLLSDCTESTDNAPMWVKEASADARQLLELISDADQFRDVITDRVQQTRWLQKLPTLSKIDFGGVVSE